jgi:hypothetical protein
MPRLMRGTAANGRTRPSAALRLGPGVARSADKRDKGSRKPACRAADEIRANDSPGVSLPGGAAGHFLPLARSVCGTVTSDLPWRGLAMPSGNRPEGSRASPRRPRCRANPAKGGRRVHPRLPVLAPSGEEAATHIADMVRNVKRNVPILPELVSGRWRAAKSRDGGEPPRSGGWRRRPFHHPSGGPPPRASTGRIGRARLVEARACLRARALR